MIVTPHRLETIPPTQRNVPNGSRVVAQSFGSSRFEGKRMTAMPATAPRNVPIRKASRVAGRPSQAPSSAMSFTSPNPMPSRCRITP